MSGETRRGCRQTYSTQNKMMLVDDWLLAGVKAKVNLCLEKGKVEERKIAHGESFDIISAKLWLIALNPLDLWSFKITQPYTLLPATRKKKDSFWKKRVMCDAGIWPGLLMFKKHFIKGTIGFCTWTFKSNWDLSSHEQKRSECILLVMLVGKPRVKENGLRPY